MLYLRNLCGFSIVFESMKTVENDTIYGMVDHNDVVLSIEDKHYLNLNRLV